ncbi:MAG: Stealth CR1 domain-containing protein [Clostridiales bacterium]|nr:Stealth CR1 domain-containing protein [Clostridiales bacterium]
MKNGDIDFVIAWVDGNDLEWRKEKEKYEGKPYEGNSEARFRDWENLQYWFRAVEKYAPWVRKIHFVTWGHLPDWLNTSDPRLHIVKHTDYIPEEYLPTYSSHTIELNFHRIKGLSEKFVYFNDDMFLAKTVEPDDFFAKDIPCDTAALSVHCYALSRPIQLISIRDVGVINEHFDFKTSVKKNIHKWMSPKYGFTLLRTLALLGSPRYPGFYLGHAANSYLKSTYEKVWEKEYQILNETCMHRFREMTDVNQWVMKEWQLAEGNFIPRKASFSKAYFAGGGHPRETMDAAAHDIINHTHSMVCINDSDISQEDFQYCKSVINEALNFTLPNKSRFER